MKRILPVMAIAFGASVPAMAEEEDLLIGSERPPEAMELDEPEAGEKFNRLSVDVGAAVVSKYISRGIGFAEEPSLQAHATLNIDLPEATGGAVTGARLFAGSWNNVKLGSVPPGEAGQLTRFYETDLYVGGSLEFDERWTISATYYRYESLGESFDGYNDFELIVGFDDADAWGDAVPLRNFTLSPSLRLVQEAGRPAHDDALYVQPSLTPAFDIGSSENPVRVTIPLAFGFSDDYYDDVRGGTETFGFFRTGVAISGRPMPDEVPAFGVNGGVDIWVLNDNVPNGLGDNELVGRVGASWSF